MWFIKCVGRLVWFIKCVGRLVWFIKQPQPHFVLLSSFNIDRCDGEVRVRLI